MTGKSITWSEDGEPTKDPTVVIVQGGVYKNPSCRIKKKKQKQNGYVM